MTTVPKALRHIVQLLAFVLLCACTSELQSQESVVTTNDQLILRTTTVVIDYVINSKHWERSAFQVEFNRKEDNALVFWVLHSDDRASKNPGTGKSFEVYVDSVSGKVLKELAFQ